MAEQRTDSFEPSGAFSPPYVSQWHIPTRREWTIHAALFLLTAVTCTVAYIMFMHAVVPAMQQPRGLAGWALSIPVFYVKSTIATMAHALRTPGILAEGTTFSLSLLAILASHEAGHYVACRRYGVDATLPFFIPAPPILAAGTFGAFIRIKSAIPTHRALFDIGVAGPIAGFVVAVPVCIAGVAVGQVIPVTGEGVIYFNDPLLPRAVAWLFGKDLRNMQLNPYYFAAWIGFLATSLNLLPVGQLDGGHAVYSVFGREIHARTGPLAFVVMVMLAVLGLVWHSSLGGFFYAILLAIILRLPHPRVIDETQRLDRKRLAVALLTLLIFLLSFVPFPISFN